MTAIARRLIELRRAAFVPLEFPPWIKWGKRQGALVDRVALRIAYPDYRHLDRATGKWVGVKRCGWCGVPCPKYRSEWCGDTHRDLFYRVHFWRSLTSYIYERDGGACVRCLTTDPSPYAWECDHIVPIADGGTDEPSNLRNVCHTCHVAIGYEQRAARKSRATSSSIEVFA